MVTYFIIVFFSEDACSFDNNISCRKENSTLEHTAAHNAIYAIQYRAHFTISTALSHTTVFTLGTLLFTQDHNNLTTPLTFSLFSKWSGVSILVEQEVLR